MRPAFVKVVVIAFWLVQSAYINISVLTSLILVQSTSSNEWNSLQETFPTEPRHEKHKNG